MTNDRAVLTALALALVAPHAVAGQIVADSILTLGDRPTVVVFYDGAFADARLASTVLLILNRDVASARPRLAERGMDVRVLYRPGPADIPDQGDVDRVSFAFRWHDRAWT